MIILLILSNQANYVIIAFFSISIFPVSSEIYEVLHLLFFLSFFPFLFTQKLQWLLPIQFQDTRQLLFQNENQILICLQWMFWKLIEKQVTCHRNDKTEQQICGKGFYIQVKEELGEQSTGGTKDFWNTKMILFYFFSNPELNQEWQCRYTSTVFFFFQNHFKM